MPLRHVDLVMLALDLFIPWEEPPKVGIQVIGTIHPATSPILLYLVMINENKIL